jgi:general secretion pathway protein M
MNPLLAQWRRQWLAQTPRDRLLLSVALACVGLLLVWMIGVRPAWQAWRELPRQELELEQQWLQMQRLAAEARELKALPPVSPALAAQALKAATVRLGEHGKLQILGDRATLTLTTASPELLRAWLAEARQSARARTLELQLTRDDDGLSGRVVMALPASGG